MIRRPSGITVAGAAADARPKAFVGEGAVDWLIGHLIGDYLLQNDWMATTKKSHSLPCLVHVGLYTAAVGALTWWPWWALAVVAVTHFVQDRTQIVLWWMRATRQTGFTKPPLAPWSLIVVDNVWHLVVLYALDRAVA